MRYTLKFLIKFYTVLAVMTVVCTVGWEGVVSELLYDCTDAFGFDYWQPGNWVHGHVAFVPQVTHHRPMSEPDTIKEGWTVSRLWILWFLCVSGSLCVSYFFACLPWNLHTLQRTHE